MIPVRLSGADARRRVSGTLLSGLVVVLGTVAGDDLLLAQEERQTVLEQTVERHCLTCHDERRRVAGLSLEGISSQRVGEQVPVLEKVLHKIRAGEMPPSGRRPLGRGLATDLIAWLESELDRAAERNPEPGAPALHRLNRAEYRNAVRDLLRLDLDHARDLPTDDSGYGFDNIGDVLTVSPFHVEKYVAAARRTSRLAVGTGSPVAVVEKFRRPRGTTGEVIDELPPNEHRGLLFEHYFPFDGEYEIRVRVGGRRSDTKPPPRLDLRLDGHRVELFEAAFDNAEAALGSRFFGTRIRLDAGRHEVAAAFLAEYTSAETAETATEIGNDTYRVDHVLVEGPYESTGPGDTEPRRRIFTCRPATHEEEAPCARRILSDLARQAYRRPVVAGDLEPLMGLFDEGRREGAFDAGIEMALAGILVSPNFLFRSETPPEGTPAGTVYRLSDLDLASRLSFFLWSSLPDEELLGLAEKGALHDPAVLDEQIERMLADEKAIALVENFAGQWLHLRNVGSWQPDAERFEEFGSSLRYAFERETELFLRNLIRDDRSVLELIDADYSFLNERLAAFYGIEGVEGGYFRRASLAGSERRGIVTHASILMVTSYPTRTSPVLRGKWVLENLLGSPPPAPPPDVPTLDDRAQNSARGLREALESHRADAGCAVCHDKLDPLGFALEGFDAIGAYRTEDNGEAVEDQGELPDGTRIEGARGLTEVLLERRVEVVETVAERLLTYALGRGLEPYDRPAVRAIRRRAAAEDYRFSSLVRGIADSLPFTHRRVPPG